MEKTNRYIAVALTVIAVSLVVGVLVLAFKAPSEQPTERGTMQTWTAYSFLSGDVYTTAVPLVGVGGFTATLYGANVARFGSTDGAFLYRIDGTCPSGGVGHSVPVDVTVELQGGGNIAGLCFIADGTHADIVVTLLK